MKKKTEATKANERYSETTRPFLENEQLRKTARRWIDEAVEAGQMNPPEDIETTIDAGILGMMNSSFSYFGAVGYWPYQRNWLMTPTRLLRRYRVFGTLWPSFEQLVDRMNMQHEEDPNLGRPRKEQS